MGKTKPSSKLNAIIVKAQDELRAQLVSLQLFNAVSYASTADMFEFARQALVGYGVLRKVVIKLLRDNDESLSEYQHAMLSTELGDRLTAMVGRLAKTASLDWSKLIPVRSAASRDTIVLTHEVRIRRCDGDSGDFTVQLVAFERKRRAATANDVLHIMMRGPMYGGSSHDFEDGPAVVLATTVRPDPIAAAAELLALRRASALNLLEGETPKG